MTKINIFKNIFYVFCTFYQQYSYYEGPTVRSCRFCIIYKNKTMHHERDKKFN